MQILLNGKPCETRAAFVDALVGELGFDPSRIAVVVNDAVIAPAARATTPLRVGDRVEILTFVAGG
jgi:thiamine biosynthesis protein ThiS